MTYFVSRFPPSLDRVFWTTISKHKRNARGNRVANERELVLESKISDTQTLVQSLEQGILGRCGAGKILGEDGHPCVLNLAAADAARYDCFDTASDTIAGVPTTVAYAPLQDTPGKVEGVVQLFFEEEDKVRGEEKERDCS